METRVERARRLITETERTLTLALSAAPAGETSVVVRGEAWVPGRKRTRNTLTEVSCA